MFFLIVFKLFLKRKKQNKQISSLKRSFIFQLIIFNNFYYQDWHFTKIIFLRLVEMFGNSGTNTLTPSLASFQLLYILIHLFRQVNKYFKPCVYFLHIGVVSILPKETFTHPSYDIMNIHTHTHTLFTRLLNYKHVYMHLFTYILTGRQKRVYVRV